MKTNLNLIQDSTFLAKACAFVGLVAASTVLSLANTAALALPFSWAWNKSLASLLKLPTIGWTEAFAILLLLKLAQWCWIGIEVSGKIRD
jgi:hypothetical protein